MTAEQLKLELDKIDKNTYHEICGMGNIDSVLQVINSNEKSILENAMPKIAEVKTGYIKSVIALAGLIPTYTDDEADRMRKLIKNAEQQIEEIERNFSAQLLTKQNKI